MNRNNIDKIAKKIMASAYDIIRDVFRYWKIGDCELSRIVKNGDNVTIIETTKLRQCYEALNDLYEFLAANGYESPETLKVTVVRNGEEYNEPIAPNAQYGLQGDSVTIELNGQTWKWGLQQ